MGGVIDAEQQWLGLNKRGIFKPKMKKPQIKEESFWSDGSFAQKMGPEEAKTKMRTFHMKHDKEMNYNCKKCNKKISAHNKDWHNGMCDACFNKKYFPDNEES